MEKYKMFTDRVKFKLVAGKGGNGVVAWRREKYIPKGGPAGGNGGEGGSIIFEANAQEMSLESNRHRRFFKAESGVQGGGNQRQGRRGKDLIINVPCGTLVKDSESGEILFDFTEDKQRWIACKGGRGGLGNVCFKSPTNQAPNKCTLGKEGEMREVELELKLIADVGLVGYPNAGKSTLISALAPVRVKIAPYPFTTLRPNLGYVDFEDFSRVLVADIPGIIEGAHCNKGLGFEFLRHIERTRMLIYVLDASGIDGRTPTDDFKVLKNELASYDAKLTEKPFLVLLNKSDTPESKGLMEEFHEEFSSDSLTIIEGSALFGDGMPTFRDHLHQVFGFKPKELQLNY
ncbi:GTPase Obg [Chlamydiales bacterium SCGC AG-110-M15]|nr:GTPase Obg [Chlamydiales bacterium SCGC AG-110-M15]